MKTLNALGQRDGQRVAEQRPEVRKNGEEFDDIAADYPALTVDDLEAIREALEK